MKYLIILLMLFTFNANADDDKHFTNYECVLFDGDVVMCVNKKTGVVWTVSAYFFMNTPTRVES